MKKTDKYLPALMDGNMPKKLSHPLLIAFIILALLIFSVATFPAKAQGATTTVTPLLETATATPTWIPLQAASPTATATSPALIQPLADPNLVTFAQIQGETRIGDILLRGPFDADGLTFAIPASWEMKEGSELILRFGVSFNSFSDVAGPSDVIVIGGGTLSVYMNDVLISTLSLSEVGEEEQRIPIPLAALEAVRRDKINVLWFRLESAESCRLFGQYTTVFIHPTSYVALPHDEVQPTTNFLDFPRPIIQRSFFPDSALLIMPDQPTAAELQAALTTAAGLGKLSSNEIILNSQTFSQFNEALAKDKNIILVGKAASLPILANLSLPLPVKETAFEFTPDGSDDGLLALIPSPWGKSNVVLVISANSDAGIIKAAQAISTGVVRPNRQNNLALIQKVNHSPVINSILIDRTLTDLGYQGRTFEARGYNSEQYVFNVPAGMSVNPDAYFEMVYGHSSLMDFNSSQIVLMLNGQPIGSVVMDEVTATVPTNRAKILIPPAAIRPGDNLLEVIVNMVPIDECSPPDSRGMWVNLWPQSTLHLPMVAVSNVVVTPQNLGTYPAPFNFDPTLNRTAFVLEKNSLQSWQNALKIAAYLGYQTSGSIIELAAFYGDEILETERANYNLLIMGRPSQMPIVREMNNNLPAPFVDNGDMANDSSFQVAYRIPFDSPMGYLETMQSPWNSNYTVLAVLGNTTQGLNWAANVLIDPLLRSRLAGNFATVNDSQILTASISYSVADAGAFIPTQAPSANANPAALMPNAGVVASQPQWVLPALIVTASLIVLMSMAAILRRVLINKTRRHAVSTRRGSGGEKMPKA